MMLATLSRHQWASADYERMISASMFEKIELLWGDVVITGASINVVKNVVCLEWH